MSISQNVNRPLNAEDTIHFLDGNDVITNYKDYRIRAVSTVQRIKRLGSKYTKNDHKTTMTPAMRKWITENRVEQNSFKFKSPRPTTRSFKGTPAQILKASNPFDVGVKSLRTGEMYEKMQQKSMDRTERTGQQFPKMLKPHYRAQSEIVTTISDLIKDDDQTDTLNLLQTLRLLSVLRFDLQINYEVASSVPAEPKQPGTHIGSYSDFKALHKSLTFEDSKKMNREQFIQRMMQCNKPIREILLQLAQAGLNNQAKQIQLIWEVIIKTWDQGLLTASEFIGSQDDTEKTIASAAKKKWNKTYENLHQKFYVYKKKTKAEIAELKAHLEREIEGRFNAEELLRKREQELIKITDIDQRNESLTKMSRLFNQLDSFLTQTSKEKANQIKTLMDISDVMELKKLEDAKGEKFPADTQTSQSVPPEFKGVDLGDYWYEPESPLLKILAKARTSFEISKSELYSVCDQALTNRFTTWTSDSFATIFCKTIIQKYGTHLDIIEKIGGAALKLKEMSASGIPFAQFMTKLLGIETPPLAPAWIGILEAIEMTIMPLQCHKELSIGKVMEVLKNLFPDDYRSVKDIFALLIGRISKEEIIESVEDEARVAFTPPKKTNALLARLALAIESTNKNPRDLLVNDEILNQTSLRGIFLQVFNLWATDEEFDELVDKFFPNYTREIHRDRFLTEFDYYNHLDNAKRLRVHKWELYNAVATVWTERYMRQISSIAELSKPEDYGSFCELLLRLRPTSTEEELLNYYISLWGKDTDQFREFVFSNSVVAPDFLKPIRRGSPIRKRGKKGGTKR